MTIQTPDNELVEQAKSGNEDALTTLYERYATPIYRYIYYRVGDIELAQDIQAEVFLRMVEGIHRYEDRGWPLSAWLYRIAHDRTVDMLRRRSRRYHVPIEYWDGSCEGPEDAISMRLEHEEVMARLGDLTAEQRQVIVMRFVREMSIQEVAEQLGRTEGSVKALQHRGLQSLARHFGAQAA